MVLPKMKFSAKIIILLLSTLSIIGIYSLTDKVKSYSVDIKDYKAEAKQFGNAWDSCWLVEWSPKVAPKGETEATRKKNNMFITCGK